MTHVNNNKNINVQNISFGKKTEEKNIDTTLSKLQKQMLSRAEREIPEYGNFSKIKETIENQDKNAYAGEISLICEPSEDNPKKRYLSFNQMNPENRKGLSCLIGYGEKEDILDILKDENFVENLKQDSERISQKMKDMKW